APAEVIWMVCRRGSVPSFRIAAGFTPCGRTTYSTWSALSGNSSPPDQTSASMPGGRAPNLSGVSGSHTRINFCASVWSWTNPLQAEVAATLWRDEVGVLGVLLDPGVDVGAEREHGQPALARVVEAVPGQVPGQALALEGVVDLSVQEADHAVVVAELVLHEAREIGPHVQLVPGGGRVVGDHGRVGGGWFHDRHDTREAPNWPSRV